MNVTHLDKQIQDLREKLIQEEKIINDDLSRSTSRRDAQVRWEAIRSDLTELQDSRKALLAKKENSDLYENVKEERNHINNLIVE